MKVYKEKLKMQLAVAYVCVGILLAFSLWAFGAEYWGLPFPSPRGDVHWISQWRGFLSGASCGIVAVMLFGICRMHKALKSEENLKKFYVKEHDERKTLLCAMAGSAAFRSSLLLGMAAMVIAGYFSIPVFLTILSCTMVQSLLSLGFRLYYEKKI